MKRFIVSGACVALACAAVTGSALGEPKTKTQLVGVDGESVEIMQLRYDFKGTWVVDKQNVLYRDNSGDYYQVTLKEACTPLGIRHRGFAFHPGSRWQLRQTSAYEVRPVAGAPCKVAKIARIDEATATPLRDASLWRVW